MGEIYLGFTEEPENRRLLTSHLFPSKLGGRPQWLSLDPDQIPNADRLRCARCNEVMKFLLQLYCPPADADLSSAAFHRALFVFGCQSFGCYQRHSDGVVDGSSTSCCPVKVFRSQLCVSNNFYSPEKPDYEDDSVTVGPESEPAFLQKLCCTCGIRGEKRCGQCRAVNYCCKEHQVYHWRNGHSAQCKSGGLELDELVGRTEAQFCFATLEILPELESDFPVVVDEQLNKLDDQRLLEKVRMEETGKDTAGIDDPDSYVVKEDKMFKRFKKRIARQPNQVLRYARLDEPNSGHPLWVAEAVPVEQVPPCKRCGSQRICELQILPQALSYLKPPANGRSSGGGQASVDVRDLVTADPMDWGSVYVFTCAGNCELGNDYAEEVVIIQHFRN